MTITGKNLELTDVTRAYIEDKVQLLKKHFDKIIHVDVEFDRDMHHKHGEVFHVSMNVHIPGKLLRASETAETLYKAIDNCRKDIDRQLRSYKAKKFGLGRKDRAAIRDHKTIDA